MNSDTHGIQMNKAKNECTVHRPWLVSSIIINHIFVQRFTISLAPLKLSHKHTVTVVILMRSAKLSDESMEPTKK